MLILSFFFFNDTATTEIYTLSLHDALPISELLRRGVGNQRALPPGLEPDVHRRKHLDGHGHGQQRPRVDLEQHERSEEHTSELQSPCNLVCRLLLEKKKKNLQQRSADRTAR